MSLVEMNEENFNEVIHDNDIVLIAFGVAGDEHCTELTELFAACSERNPDITFATCDVGAVPAAALSFAIADMPTVVAFREQILLFKEPSARRSAWLRSQDRLDTAVSRIKQMDMEKVRRMSSTGANG